jgi:hypothetical protein
VGRQVLVLAEKASVNLQRSRRGLMSVFAGCSFEFAIFDWSVAHR